jgi:hypothetical protein
MLRAQTRSVDSRLLGRDRTIGRVPPSEATAPGPARGNADAGAGTSAASAAEDLLPAILASVPLILLVLVTGFADDPVLLHALIFDGQPVNLTASLVPLFLPVIGATVVSLGALRGWWAMSRERTGPAAVTTGAVLAVFTPINYLALQLSVVGVVFVARLLRRHVRASWIRLVGVVTALAVLIGCVGVIAGWKLQRDYMARVVVGRVIDGLVRWNIEYGGRSENVLIISREDAYSLVVSSEYPYALETIPAATMNKGWPCRVRPNWNQRTLLSFLLGGAEGGTRICG